MSFFEQELERRLEEIRAAGLYRELRKINSGQSVRLQADGKSLLNFSSNDYLGLASHPALAQAAKEAVAEFGTGSGASRLICGSLAPHHRLEETLAEFKGSEAALSFSSGYATALGTIAALLGKEDIIILDKLVHASIVDAARLAGAKLRIFAHNDLESLEDILKWAVGQTTGTPKAANESTRPPAILIVTESVFSMDGDQAPLRKMAELKQKYGAWLMVDEAHATGLFGARRRGLSEEQGVADQIEVHMGTLGKALGSAGGYICGSRKLIEFLVNKARSFIFSTAPVPAAAAAATAAIRLVMSREGEQRAQVLWARVKETATGLGTAEQCGSAVIPLMIGNEASAMRIAASLRDLGLLIPAVRFPTVPKGKARLRLTLTSNHTSEDISILLHSLARVGLGLQLHASATP